MKTAAMVLLVLFVADQSCVGRCQSFDANIGVVPECCFSYYTKRIPPRAIAGYKITDPNCPKKAVILITLRGKEVCTNPEDKQIQDIMNMVDFLFG